VVKQEDENGETQSIFFEPSESSAKASVGQDRNLRDAIRILGTLPFSSRSRGQMNLRVKCQEESKVSGSSEQPNFAVWASCRSACPRTADPFTQLPGFQQWASG